jgi:hypothetical protein
VTLPDGPQVIIEQIVDELMKLMDKTKARTIKPKLLTHSTSGWTASGQRVALIGKEKLLGT